MSIEIVDLPINSMVMFHMLVCQRVPSHDFMVVILVVKFHGSHGSHDSWDLHRIWAQS